ncbi:MAG TPA: hypothetical protein VFI65_26320 [Streptosporangiaceae bacterium]|nr:hypothetical protein [Streptosporangiaceae bacterium]
MTAAVVAGVAVGIAGASSVALAASAYKLPPPVAFKAKHHPKIVAKPNRVKVNKFTTLSGSGFKPHHKYVLNECSARAWVVPKQVCNHRNAVHVRTGPHGGFRVRMKVLACPRGMQPQSRVPRLKVRGPDAFVVHCFIGTPRIAGVDTETLVGAVRISVTGPKSTWP